MSFTVFLDPHGPCFAYADAVQTPDGWQVTLNLHDQDDPQILVLRGSPAEMASLGRWLIDEASRCVRRNAKQGAVRGTSP